MNENVPDTDREIAMLREIARIALASVDGFALAGSGAIRQHGVIERPTEDIDLFTASPGRHCIQRRRRPRES